MMSSQDAFIEAIKDGDAPQVTSLLDADPELLAVRIQGTLSPALLAMYYNEPEIAQTLVRRGALLDIFAAAGCGQVEEVRRLLDAQPELLNAFAADGFQPLGLAAFFGQVAVVQLLLERGAEVNRPSRNPMRVMPLHSAAAAGHLEICRLLLEHGAQVNAAQADEFTPLHAAAQNDDVALTELLLQHGATLDAHAAGELTPLGMARKSGSTAVAHLLEMRGAAG
jgi:ankyrin repeat protein